MHDELLAYVAQSRAVGLTDNEIAKALLDAGWDQASVAQAVQPKKKHRILKTAFLTMGVIALLVAIVVYLPNIYNVVIPDDAPLDDSKLQLSTLQISPSENAYFDLEAISSALNLTGAEKNTILDYINDRKEVDEATVIQIVDKNVLAVQAFVSSSQKPYYQHPDFISPHITKADNTRYTAWRDATYVTAAMSRLLSKAGNTEDATALAISLVAFGTKIMDGQNPMTAQLVGLSIRDIGLKSMIAIDANPDLSEYERSEQNWKDQLKVLYHEQKALLAVTVSNDVRAIAQYYGDPLYEQYTSSPRDWFRVVPITHPNKTQNLYTNLFQGVIDSPRSICELASLPEPRLPMDTYINFIATNNDVRNDHFNTVSSIIQSRLEKMCESQQLLAKVKNNS